MAYIPPTGSVVTFQSDATKENVTAFQQAGSVMAVNATVTPPANQSVSGTVGASVLGTVPITQGGPLTTSISGGISSVTQAGQWNMAPASVQLMSGTNVIGSVATLQGTSPWTVQLTSGSVLSTTGNSSVQLVNGNAVIGSVAQAGNWLIQPASVQLMAGTNVIGSVATLQGTNPWIVQLTSGSVITSGGNSSVQVVGTMPASSVYLIPGIGVLGSVAALQGTNPWLVQTVGSVETQYREDTAATSMMGNALIFRQNDSTSMMSIVGPLHPLPIVGSVVNSGGITSVTQAGQWNLSPASVQLLGSTNVIGSVAALQGTQPWLVQVVTSVAARFVTGISSVQLMAGTNNQGSVTAIQGTNPWTMTSSGSILGNYGVNSVFANNNVGFANFNVRNDTVASLITTDKTWGPAAVDASGRIVVMPFAPFASSVYGHTSTVNSGDAASVVVISAAAAGLKNYITDYQVTNTGATATLVTFTEGGASILGKTIAPAGGGSNMPGMNFPLKNQKAAQPINMVVATASSTIHVTMYGFTAP